MVTFGLLSILTLLGIVGVGVIIGTVISKPRASQLGSGQSPQLPAKGASQGGAHRIVALHPGTPLAAQLREHANTAEVLGLRPFLEFGAMWCPPSRMFGESLGDPRISRALTGIYLIRAEIDDFSSDPRALELRAVAVPVFYELDADGQSTGRSVNGGAWGADTIENMSGTMARFFAG